MVRELMIAAAVGAMFMGSASAEPASDEMNLGMMHWIRDTVCTPDREIVFVPVSHDIPTLQGGVGGHRDGQSRSEFGPHSVLERKELA